MTPSVHDFLAADHARFDGLVAVALAADGLDLAAYEQFRAGLLRHIGMEEKILLPAAKRARGGTALPAARLLRHDHSALAALLVPTPTRALLERIRAVLALHNPLEEGADGVYAACERLAGPDADALLAQLRATPPVPVAAHFDGPRAFEAIERLLYAAGDARGDGTLFLRTLPAHDPCRQ